MRFISTLISLSQRRMNQPEIDRPFLTTLCDNYLDFYPLRYESIQKTKLRRQPKPGTQYTYPQLLVQKSATRPGSILDRQGGSIFNRR